MTNTTPHGQVPEALIDLIDTYAETEAARKAVIEALSGVQALSAAPAGWKLVPVNPTPEMWKAAKSVPDPNPPYPPHYGLVWDAMLAASPTPPAEQQAAYKAAPGGPFDECFPGEPRVAVPQGLIGAACFAISNKRDGGKVLEQLRRYSVGDLSQPLAPQQEAQEPAPSAAVFGLRLVPVEPTDQMVQAAHHIDLSYMPGQEGADRAAIYRAMIAAAPQPAVQQWNDLIGQETYADADGLLVWRDEVDFAIPTPPAEQQAAPQPAPESIRSILIRCREFIDTTKVPAYPAGADLADEIDVLLAAQPAPAPLTDAQIAEMMRDTWGCASIAPRHALEFARAVERAHGIAQKGGS